MSYAGYLIKLGGSGGTVLPTKFIKPEGYEITPNQRMETEAKRSVTGVLYRSTVEHTATKIEIMTPNMTNEVVAEMMALFREFWTSSIERKLDLEYYDIETDTYKTGTFYMPDIKFQISHADDNSITYRETRIAFIEY